MDSGDEEDEAQRAEALCQRCSEFISTSKSQLSPVLHEMAQGDFKAGYIKPSLGKDPRVLCSEPSFMFCLVSLFRSDPNNTMDNK